MNIHQETEKRRLFKFLTVATNFELQVKSKHNLASLKTMLKNNAYIHHEDEDHYYTRIKIR